MCYTVPVFFPMSIIVRNTVFHDTIISLTLFSKTLPQNETHSFSDLHILVSSVNTIWWQCKLIYEQTDLNIILVKKVWPL